MARKDKGYMAVVWLSWMILFLTALKGLAYGFNFDIIGIVIAFFCARKCAKYAEEIKSSKAWAYAIGFCFSLLGMLGYWIYYKSKNKRRNQQWYKKKLKK